MGWTEERTESLRLLWAEGLSASQIGDRFGITRNAVIGKVHRLGLAGRLGPQWRAWSHGKPRSPNRIYPPRQPAQRQVPAAKPAPAARLMLPPVPAVLPAPEPSLHVALLDLTDDACRWPYGDPKRDFAGFGFCGRDADGPYCADHARLAYRPAARRRR